MAHLTQNQAHVADRPAVAISEPASTVGAEATLAEALRVLLGAGSKHLVVVAPGGGFAGVLSARQLIAAWAGSPEAFGATPVTEVLDPVPPTVAPSATVHTVARVMRDYCSDVVVVIGQGRTPVGVVTAADIAAVVADPD